LLNTVAVAVVMDVADEIVEDEAEALWYRVSILHMCYTRSFANKSICKNSTYFLLCAAAKFPPRPPPRAAPTTINVVSAISSPYISGLRPHGFRRDFE
jgi:hypothetical protein